MRVYNFANSFKATSHQNMPYMFMLWSHLHFVFAFVGKLT